MKKKTLLDKIVKDLGKSEEEVLPSISHIHVQLCGASGTGGRFGEARVPFEYSDLFLSNSPAKDGQKKIYKALESYVESFKRDFRKTGNPEEDEVPIKNLYLWSHKKGTGKTSTAAALLNEYMFLGWKASVAFKSSMKRPPAYFLDVNNFQTTYNKFTRNGIAREIAEETSREYYEMMDIASTAPLVVMDDLATRSATEAFRADLHDIINKRMVSGLPTIYTSNEPVSELETIFDERLADRIKNNSIALEFKGSSHRKVLNG
jgi:DNA replication protein DnaC